MILPVDSSRHRRRRRAGSSPPNEPQIHLPKPSRLAWADISWSLGLLLIVTVALFLGGKLPMSRLMSEEEVQIIEAAPPPLPPKVVEKPKPLPPPPPEPKAPPPPKAAPPPPPVFGLPESATNDKGDMEVATGNTLMKTPDSVVKPPPPPPPPAPIQISQEPEALEKVLPVYPAWAEEQGVTSRVRVTVVIDAKGNVVSAEVQKSGGKDFDDAALRAARVTRYKPYIEKGQALPARFTVTYEFVL